jgi:hypothetical protein
MDNIHITITIPSKGDVIVHHEIFQTFSTFFTIITSNKNPMKHPTDSAVNRKESYNKSG